MEFPRRRSSGLVVQEHDTELLVYDLRTHRAHALNAPLRRIWELCDGTRSITEIDSELSAVSGEEASYTLLIHGLVQLREAGLLDGAEYQEADAVFSRRDLVRKAGTAGLAALPVLTSIIVPTAAAAQSGACGVTAGQTCSCTGKVRNFGIPCDSTDCGGGCACVPPFTGCNGGGHFCQGTCA